MTPDEIKKLLASLPTSAMLPRPPGTVAIPSSRVTNHGGDLDEVKRWLRGQGGGEKTVEVPAAESLGGGRLVPRSGPRIARYLVVPETALLG